MQSAVVRVQQLRSIFTLRAFDTSHPEGRARERHRRAALTGLAAAVSKAIALCTGLITIPMALHYLGTERFGLWMTINSILAVLSFADFGIGNGILNAIAEASGKDDLESALRYLESGIVLLSGISVLLVSLFALVYHWIPWPRVFNVHSDLAAQEAGPAVAVFAGCFALNIIVGVVQRTQMALQEGFVSNLWQLLGSMGGLMAVLLVIHLQGGLAWLVLALAGAPVLATFVNGIVFFGWLRPELRPTFRLVSLPAMRRVAHIGVLFFVLQLAVAMAYSADNIIITQAAGPEAVARYAITAKLFSMISLVIAMFLNPLWPAYGEAISRGDFLWVKRTLLRSIFGAMFVASLGALVLIFFGPVILKLWVRRDFAPGFLLLVGFGLWTVIEGFGNALAMFLNGANIVKLQVIVASIFASCCLTVKIYVVRKYGVVGIPWATLGSYILFSAIPCIYFIPTILNRLNPAVQPSPEVLPEMRVFS